MIGLVQSQVLEDCQLASSKCGGSVYTSPGQVLRIDLLEGPGLCVHPQPPPFPPLLPPGQPPGGAQGEAGAQPAPPPDCHQGAGQPPAGPGVGTGVTERVVKETADLVGWPWRGVQEGFKATRENFQELSGCSKTLSLASTVLPQHIKFKRIENDKSKSNTKPCKNNQK